MVRKEAKSRRRRENKIITIRRRWSSASAEVKKKALVILGVDPEGGLDQQLEEGLAKAGFKDLQKACSYLVANTEFVPDPSESDNPTSSSGEGSDSTESKESGAGGKSASVREAEEIIKKLSAIVDPPEYIRSVLGEVIAFLCGDDSVVEVAEAMLSGLRGALERYKKDQIKAQQVQKQAEEEARKAAKRAKQTAYMAKIAELEAEAADPRTDLPAKRMRRSRVIAPLPDDDGSTGVGEEASEVFEEAASETEVGSEAESVGGKPPASEVAPVPERRCWCRVCGSCGKTPNGAYEICQECDREHGDQHRAAVAATHCELHISDVCGGSPKTFEVRKGGWEEWLLHLTGGRPKVRLCENCFNALLDLLRAEDAEAIWKGLIAFSEKAGRPVPECVLNLEGCQGPTVRTAYAGVRFREQVAQLLGADEAPCCIPCREKLASAVNAAKSGDLGPLRKILGTKGIPLIVVEDETGPELITCAECGEQVRPEAVLLSGDAHVCLVCFWFRKAEEAEVPSGKIRYARRLLRENPIRVVKYLQNAFREVGGIVEPPKPLPECGWRGCHGTGTEGPFQDRGHTPDKYKWAVDQLFCSGHWWLLCKLVSEANQEEYEADRATWPDCPNPLGNPDCQGKCPPKSGKDGPEGNGEREFEDTCWSCSRYHPEGVAEVTVVESVVDEPTEEDVLTVDLMTANDLSVVKIAPLAV